MCALVKPSQAIFKTHPSQNFPVIPLHSACFPPISFPTGWPFPGGSDGKEPTCNVGDPGSIPGLGRSPGEGNGNPLQYSCLEIPMDGGAWQAIVHGVAKNWTRPSDFTFYSSAFSHILFNGTV